MCVAAAVASYPPAGLSWPLSDWGVECLPVEKAARLRRGDGRLWTACGGGTVIRVRHDRKGCYEVVRGSTGQRVAAYDLIDEALACSLTARPSPRPSIRRSSRTGPTPTLGCSPGRGRRLERMGA